VPNPRQSKEFSNFDKLHEDFDKQFNSMRRTAATGLVFSMVITLAVLGFVGWVIVKLMAHFGVV
jgi:hypothetical protein